EIQLALVAEGEAWQAITEAGTFKISRAGGTFAAHRSTIDSISFAASFAAGYGSTSGIAVSGAGALSANVVLSSTSAFVESSHIVSGDDVAITASNASAITAIVSALSVA